MIYAQLENDICVGISNVANEIIDENYVQIENYDVSLIGRILQNGYWIDSDIVYDDPDMIKNRLILAIQQFLDAESQAHFYDGILSLCSYATSVSPKFGPEGRSGVVWRDACWTKGYEILAECEAETRVIPTVDELLAEMPSMCWPS